MSLLGIVRCTLLCSLIGISSAQEPTPAERFAATRAHLVAEARTQLGAIDLATVAWGAHAVAEYRLAECIPQLRESLAKLANLAKPESQQTQLAGLATLDALVETDAILPGEELAPFLIGWCRDAALMLLGRRPILNRALLLEQYRALPPSTEARFACGVWLASIQDPAFLRELLQEPVMMRGLVGDKGDDLLRDFELLPVASTQRPHIPDSFPPTGFRQLTVDLSGDTRNGAAITLGRQKYPDGFCIASYPYSRTLNTARNEWLRQFLGENGQGLEFDLAPAMGITWAGVEPLRQQIAKKRGEVEADFKTLVAVCVRAKLIAAESIAGEIAIDVRLNDFRSDQEPPLPKSKEWSIVSK